jgi:deferrochelatase/peroxidase EfeB
MNGTANLKAEDGRLLDRQLWAQRDDGSDWMHNGSYLVARRIRMHIEVWDRTTSPSSKRSSVGSKAPDRR